MRRVLFALLPLTLVLAACQTGVSIGGPCGADDEPTGTDGTYVLVCRDGRWTPTMTAREWVDLARGEDVAIAPLPEMPPLPEPATTEPPVTTTTVPPTTTTTTTPPVPDALAITGGMASTCALTPQGAVRCWGDNRNGQMGDGTTADRSSPVDVIGLTTGVVAVTSGANNHCALTSTGGVKCWGQDVGVGGFPAPIHTTPADVPGLTSGVASIGSGETHHCAVMINGDVKCWGSNDYGQLGNGTTTATPTPTDVVGLGSAARSVIGGYGHTCALMVTGGVKCWGEGAEGALGDGNNTSTLTPVDVVGLGSDTAVIQGGNLFTCALSSAGAVHCWGRNHWGQVGDGATSVGRSTPTQVVGLTSGVVELAVGDVHSCVRVTGGTVKCWGYNANGQLGNGTTTDSPQPVAVSGITTAAGVGTGFYHSCVVLTDDSVDCWGYNSDGQLGDGTRTSSRSPVGVVGPI